MPRPCLISRTDPHTSFRADCPLCALDNPHSARFSPTHHAKWNGLAVPAGRNRSARAERVATPTPCSHVGPQIGETDCRSCGGRRVTLKLFECRHPEQPLGAAVCAKHGCGSTCPGYETAHRTEANSGAPAKSDRSIARNANPLQAGVVIGSYGWPALIDLQIRMIRSTCGPVPILVSDDCSPGFPDGARFARLTALCARHADVMLWPSAERIGHTGGDIAAYWKGVVWGFSRGLQVVAKLSQRFVITRPDWLYEGARDLRASGLPLATQRCTGTAHFDLRTEAALLDVSHWHTPEVLERIKPRRYWHDTPKGLCAETILYRVLQDLLGGVFWPWSLFGPDRQRPSPGVLWHHYASATAYRALAEQHGVELDDDFHVAGWERELQAGTYLYG